MPTSTGGDDPGEIHYQMWSTKCGTTISNHSKPKSPKYTQSHKYNKRELNTKEKYSLKFSKHKITTKVRSNRLKWVY
jgi:hypothetical protein